MSHPIDDIDDPIEKIRAMSKILAEASSVDTDTIRDTRAMRRPDPAAYTIPNAAIYLGVSTSTIRRWVDDATIPSVRIADRTLIRKADLDQLLQVQ